MSVAVLHLFGGCGVLWLLVFARAHVPREPDMSRDVLAGLLRTRGRPESDSFGVVNEAASSEVFGRDAGHGVRG